jgi:hypothetical protein
MQGGGGGVKLWGKGPQTDNTCRKEPLKVNFLDADILLWFLYSKLVHARTSHFILASLFHLTDVPFLY